MKQNQPRDRMGRFTNKSKYIRNGCLYNFRGAVVRAVDKDASGKRLVSFHKALFGTVDDADLELVPKSKVRAYLANA